MIVFAGSVGPGRCYPRRIGQCNRTFGWIALAAENKALGAKLSRSRSRRRHGWDRDL